MKTVLDHNCPNCDAVLKFNPEQQNWKCGHCRKQYDLEFLKKLQHNIQNENEQKLDFENMEFDIFVCPNCGAEILCGDNISVTSCVYCKNTAIIKKRLRGQYKPQYIIPFKVSKENAKKILDQYHKNKFFIPKDFKNKNLKNELIGVYVPFWLYDYILDGYIKAEGIKRMFHCIKIYRIIRSGSLQFKNIPVDGSKTIDNSIMNSIEPFDYTNMVNFDYFYLSGFLSEKYDVCSKESSKDSRKRIIKTFEDKMKKTIKKYDRLKIEEKNFYFRREIAKYVLLPVWFMNVKYKNNEYIYVINGQTGKIKGEIPIDRKKEIILSIIVFIIVFLTSYLLFSLLNINESSDYLINFAITVIFIVISLIMSFAVVKLSSLILKYNYRPIRKAENANTYIKKDSMEFHQKEDWHISSRPYK